MLQLVQTLWNRIKPIITKVLVVAFFVLWIASLIVYINRPEPKVSNKQLVLEPTKQNIDKNGTTHNVIGIKELTQEELNHITDSIRKSIKGQPQIKEVIVYVPVIDTSWRDIPIVIKGDTIEVSKIDSYVTAKAVINTKTKTGDIELSLKDTVTIVRTFKRHFLKANEQTIDITNKNPYVSIPFGASIIAKEPKPIIVIGPSIVYNPLNNQFQYGIGMTFNVLSIKSKK